MKKILIATLALTTMLVTVTPSIAGNSEEVAIGILGGVVGGLVLGEVLERPRYREPVRVYEYYDEPVMVRECVTKYKRYFDEYRGTYVKRPVKKCYWVEE